MTSNQPPTLALPFTPRQGYTPTSPAIILPRSSPHTQSVKGASTYTITYQDLHSLTLSLQAQLASLNLSVGDTVSSTLGNGIEFATAFLASGWQRLIAAPLNPGSSEAEVETFLIDNSVKLLIVPQGSFKSGAAAVKAGWKVGVKVLEIQFDPQVGGGGKASIKLQEENGASVKESPELLKKPEPEDIALILGTSGTTGKSKSVPLTHANLVATMENIIRTYELTHRDRTFLVMPLFHVHGMQAAFLSTLLSGGAAVVPPKFSAGSFWGELAETRCTWYTAVPTIHSMLLNSPRPPTTVPLRFIRSCSSSLAPSVFHALEQEFKAPVLEAYAMTEAAHQMTSNPLPHKGERRPGSVGIGQGVQVKIIDDQGRSVPTGGEGEVCVKGKNVTKGYLNNPKANAESFIRNPPSGHEDNKDFFRTGDQGKLDSKGYLTLTGRIKEIINRGGEKISPLEVDSALLALKSDGIPVREAISFAVEDEMYGQKVGAALVLDQGSTTSVEDIKAALQKKLSKFKVPERVWIVDSIPKQPSGKTSRRNVAAELIAREKRSAGKL